MPAGISPEEMKKLRHAYQVNSIISSVGVFSLITAHYTQSGDIVFNYVIDVGWVLVSEG